MSISSMTGFGSASSAGGRLIVTVEMSSVNHKQLDLRLALPDLPSSVEARISELIKKNLARGSVLCRAKILIRPDAGGSFSFDEGLALAYAAELRRLGARLKLQEDLSLTAVAGMPGVLRQCSPMDEPEAEEKLLKCVEKALKDLLRMRRAEGKLLGSEMKRLIQKIELLLNRVEKSAASAPARQARKLKKRLEALGAPIDLDDQRMTRELMIFADKSDVSEEIARLRSHISQFLKKLAGPSPVGRTLDFLVQEMNREINTIGAKSTDKAIAAAVVNLKSELERVREQAQNIE